MSSSFVVENDGRVVGLAIRCKGGFRFFASEPLFRRLDRLVFPRAQTLLHALCKQGASEAKNAPDDRQPGHHGPRGQHRS